MGWISLLKRRSKARVSKTGQSLMPVFYQAFFEPKQKTAFVVEGKGRLIGGTRSILTVEIEPDKVIDLVARYFPSYLKNAKDAEVTFRGFLSEDPSNHRRTMMVYAEKVSVSLGGDETIEQGGWHGIHDRTL